MGHLDDQLYRRLVGGDLPPDEARALARHLEQDCEVCEAFLASRPAADALDGRVDLALLGLAPGGAPGNDLEFRRIEQRLAPPRPAPRRRFPRLALAAAVLVAGLAGLWLTARGPERPAWDGLKGQAPAAVPVRLRFLVLSEGAGGAPAVEKGASGQEVAAGASLQFQVELGQPANVALVRIPAQGAPEVFYRGALGAGPTDVTIDGRPAAYPLAALSGPQRFAVLADRAPLDEARARRAASRLAPPARLSPEAAGPDGLSVDVVEVRVR